MIRLGAFTLNSVVARGGMSTVWAGEHELQQIPVAVKVLAHDSDAPEVTATVFRNEVRAMARLSHPNIATVYDYGFVSSEVARASKRALRVGSPYLVMEYAALGAVSDTRPLPWQALRYVLVALLDALSHAHARGVVHRDLKPSNVLVFADRHVKLADFGLAHQIDTLQASDTGKPRLMGTPSYMAPEQFDGDWHRYSPATDLYALGCLAFALACGDPPFGRADSLAVFANAHKHHALPPLFARTPVPDGFAEWVACLLEKDPRSRFQRAADAAASLLALGSPDEIKSAPVEHDPLLAQSFVPPDTALHTLQVLDGELPSSSLSTPGRHAEDIAPPTLRTRPFPTSWRLPDRSPLSLGAIVAGLGLFWLREHALVGRDRERDLLWKRAGDVARGGCHVVILEGEAGYGKSALARWLCERAHEAGHATTLHGVHGPLAGPEHGLEPMIARLLRATGLGRTAMLAHVRSSFGGATMLDPGECVALTDLVCERDATEPNGEEPVVHFGSATERYVLLGRLLESLAQERGVIVWLDDVQWGPDALAFLQHFLGGRLTSTCGVLFVLTVRSDIIASRSAEKRLLGELDGHPRVSSQRIGALPAAARLEMVEQLLPLDASLARHAAAWSEGHPLFAIQLVGDWIDRGLLAPSATGFATHSLPARPSALDEVWEARLARVLDRHPDSARGALEIAAALGHHVDAAEWRDACTMAGVDPSSLLVEDLLRCNLATADDRGPDVGWSFSHGLLSEMITRLAHQGGRLAEHHRVCATMLHQRHGRYVGERVARHLLAAGALRDAVDPLLHAGARTRVETGDFVLADALLAEREAAMEAMRCPPDDVRWGEGWLLRARLTARRGHYAEAAEWAKRAERGAADQQWPSVHARALLLLGNVTRELGDPMGAERLVTRAEHDARALGDNGLLGECHQELGKLLMHTGALDQALEHWTHSGELLQSVGDQRGATEARLALGVLAAANESYDIAMRHARDARSSFHALGDRYGVGRALQLMGDAARRNHELSEADTYYQRALKRLRALGTADAIAICELKAALALLEGGRYAEAGDQLATCSRELERLGHRQAVGWAHAALMACAAARADWQAWAIHRETAADTLGATRFVELDIARIAELAGDLAAARGAAERAREAYELAWNQWHALGREAHVARVMGKLGAR